MGKAARLTALFTSRAFLLRFGGSCLAILGAASTVLSIPDWHLSLTMVVPFAIVVLGVSAVFASRGLVPDLLPVDDVVAYLDDTADGLVVHCPCDAGLRSQAKELAHSCFASTFTIEPNVYEQLWLKNRYILACLSDGSGRVLGYFDVIPLCDDFAKSLMRGDVSETDMSHEHVLPPEEMASCRYLYIAGIATHDSDTYRGRWAAYVLIWALFKYLAHYYKIASPLVFAIASTEKGDAILKGLKLSYGSSSRARRDKGTLYTAQLTMEDLEKRQKTIADWSNICRLDWEDNSGGVVQMGEVKRRRAVLPLRRRWDMDQAPVAAVGN